VENSETMYHTTGEAVLLLQTTGFWLGPKFCLNRKRPLRKQRPLYCKYFVFLI